MGEIRMRLGELENGRPLKVDLDSLLRNRLLIQANSGGGKSYLVRKLLEVTHGKVQHIILDIEGEFSTLREQYDYLLVGKEGEIQTDIRGAKLLAEKLLELNVSTIVDLYELKAHERLLFMKRFLDAMVNAKRELWHPCLVVIDEAHHFAPQSSKSESAASVIDLATRGRKRGFCLVAATQRISKLHKDVAAECNNKLIGRASLDVDMKRASEEIGFTSKEDMRSLRKLRAGQFYAFGPSLSSEVVLTQVDKVKTTHPEAGAGIQPSASPTPAHIKSLLKDLKDLPQKAEEELKNISEYKAKIYSLERALRAKPKPEMDKVELEKLLSKATITGYNRRAAEDKKLITDFEKTAKSLAERLNKIHAMSTPQQTVQKPSFQTPVPLEQIEKPFMEIVKSERETISPLEDYKPRAGVLKILKHLVSYHPEPLSKEQVGVLSNFTPTGGTFNAYLSELKRHGWVEETHDKKLFATSNGVSRAGDVEPVSLNHSDLLEMWSSKFRKGAVQILKVLCEEYPRALTKQDIGEATSYAFTGGTFNAYISELRRAGLIEVNGPEIVATKWLFPEGGFDG